MNVDEYAARAAGKVPKYLFKYKSLAGDAKGHTRDLIVNQRLYFPGPGELNDPFECKPHLMTAATVEQQRRYATELVNRIEAGKPRSDRRRLAKAMRSDPDFLTTMRAATQATLHAAGIFSLSARHLDPLMWPHYADNHRGVCVRFDTQALMDADDLVPFPVLYEDERPTCDTILEPTESWLNRAVLTKGKPWEYEEEWRIIRNRGAGKVVGLTAATINGVLLGAKISAPDRAEVLRWVAGIGRPFGVAQAKFHATCYAIEIENLDDLGWPCRRSA
jgi:hypothetical protein